MEKENYSQLELFSQSGSGSGSTAPANRSLLNYLRIYEKILLIVIGFIITGIVSFSLGVESGKRHKFLPKVSQTPAPAMKPPAAVVSLPAVPVSAAVIRPAPVAAATSPLLDVPKDIPGSYVIQLATFQSKIHAQKEADILRKKGFSPVIISKGAYSVLLVGNFTNKEKAQSVLPELKKQYSDCYIRRL